MKKMGKKIAIFTLTGLMVAAPVANFTGITAEAATYNRTVKVDIPQFGLTTGSYSGYEAYIVNAKTGTKALITNQKYNLDYKRKMPITVNGSATYYGEVCLKGIATKNCVKTGNVVINEQTFKSIFSSLKITVKPKGIGFTASLNLEK